MANKWLKHVRFSIGFANLIFLFVGATLLGLGAWIFDDSKDYFDAVEKGSPYGPSILSIIVGAAIVVISFCGCVGAFAKSRMMVMSYISLLLLVLILQVVAITLAFRFKDKAEENVKAELQYAMNAYSNNDANRNSALDRIHRDFECCGINGTVDWTSTSWYNTNQPKLYPVSCCVQQTADKCSNDISASYSKGCLVTFKNWTRDKMIILSSVSIALLVIQIFGILVGVVLLRMTPQTEVKPNTQT